MISLHPLKHTGRLLVEAMVMTGSDLCASAKPWDLQLETVAVIYEEFYIQVILEAGASPQSTSSHAAPSVSVRHICSMVRICTSMAHLRIIVPPFAYVRIARIGELIVIRLTIGDYNEHFI